MDYLQYAAAVTKLNPSHSRCEPHLLFVPRRLSVPEEEPVQYRVETLALFILGPVVVLVLLSVVSVVACRRLHHGRLQRLQEFDTEQGAVDGLITSNVGDSTLAVSMRPRQGFDMSQ